MVLEGTVEMLNDESVGAADADAAQPARRIRCLGANEEVAEGEVMDR